MEKFYYRGSSLNFSFLHRAHDINYEVDICVNGYGMDRIIIMGDFLLVMAGGAILSGVGRKDRQDEGKVVPVLYQTPCHEETWGN